MGDPITTAIVTAVAPVAGGIYGAYQGSQDRKAAKKEANALAYEQDQQAKKLSRKLQSEDARAEATRRRAAERQQALATGAYGRSDTLRTGPLGLIGEPPGAGGKTLLGL